MLLLMLTRNNNASILVQVVENAGSFEFAQWLLPLTEDGAVFNGGDDGYYY